MSHLITRKYIQANIYNFFISLCNYLLQFIYFANLSLFYYNFAFIFQVVALLLFFFFISLFGITYPFLEIITPHSKLNS